jgi:hypothetical protein
VIDLDAIEARNAAALARIGELPASTATLAAEDSLRDVATLVAEVHADRAVVEAARNVAPQGHADYWRELDRALAAHDRAVGR